MRTIKFEKRNQVLHPEKPFELSFRFETIFEPHDLKKKDAATHFIRTTELHCLGKVEGLFRYGIIVEDLAGKSFNYDPFLRKLASAFSTIVLKVSADGKIIEVSNFYQMKEQWAEMKSNLLIDHHGQEFQRRLAANDEVLSSELKLISFLQKPEVFGLYFNGLWGYTGQEFKTDLWTTDIHKKWLDETGFQLHIAPRQHDNPLDYGVYTYNNGTLTDALVYKEGVYGHTKFIASCLG
ncbi:hypothetical protein [Pedobacter sp. SYP-B3415]|uniref:hypothetical protein n=1 Tax=Pedobacter sp. SYP-B3415 TaxID=2496641 RepID=UPI00101DDC1A|nr:hypothetical protein [Pedobacter sp. SYP-B3415]